MGIIFSVLEMRSGVGCGVSQDPPPDPPRHGTGRAIRDNNNPTTPPPSPPRRPITTGSLSQIYGIPYDSRWRGSRGGRQAKTTSCYILCTTTFCTNLWSWRRLIAPYPWCPKCDIFVPRQDLNIRHPTTDIWRKREECKKPLTVRRRGKGRGLDNAHHPHAAPHVSVIL